MVSSVIYMGVGNAGLVQARLLNAGIDPETLVIIVENNTLATERTFETTVSELYATIKTERICGPAMIYVGLARRAAATVAPFGAPESAVS